MSRKTFIKKWQGVTDDVADAEIKQIALENGTTVSSVKREIEFAIHEAMNSPQSRATGFWDELTNDGKEPSVETVIAAIVLQVKNKMKS